MALKQRNEYEEGEIDKVFLMRQERERAINDLEAQIRQIQVRRPLALALAIAVPLLTRNASATQDKAASKLQRLPREAQAEYAELIDANSKMAADIASQQAQLEAINARIAEVEEELSHDKSREEGQMLENQVRPVHCLPVSFVKFDG